MEENITRKVKLKENVKYYEDFFLFPDEIVIFSFMLHSYEFVCIDINLK